MAFYALEQLMNLHDGYSKLFTIPGHSILLVQVDGMRYMLSNYCPHQDAPLNKGTLSEENGGSIRCSRHGISFSLASGFGSDACPNSLRFYKIAYMNSTIGVDL